MYYAAASKAPFVQNSAPGVAISRDGGKTWVRRPDPLLTPLGTPDEVSIGTVFVFRDGDRWRLYYTAVDADLRYAIRIAESDDGLSFDRPARFAAFDERPLVTAARPFVWRVADGWLMLFAHNRKPDGDRPGTTYRVHLARSTDGVTFTDAGELLGLGTPGSFDAHQCEYAWLDSGLLFYSGDGYGASGIGIVDFRDQMQRFTK